MLLASAGLAPDVRPQDVDETPRPGEAPITYAMRVATAKALACDDPRPALAADTIVAFDGECLGKAASTEIACAMLRRLSGRTHVVHTAIVLNAGRVFADIVSTSVRFRELTDAEIERYVATGEPMDKAGAYGIQGGGGALVDRVDGSYTNVVGLPLRETLCLLGLAGVIDVK